MIFLVFALFIVFIIGYSISGFFLIDKAYKIEIIPIAFMIGLISAGYFILFASILSGSFVRSVWFFMAIGAVYSIYFGFKNYKQIKNYFDTKKINFDFLIQKIKERSWLEMIFFVLFVIFFFDIFFKTVFYENGVYRVAMAGYGDIPFHMAQVSYFVHNNPFGLEEPIYLGIPLVYAFLINFLSSIFYVLSGNYILSFNLPSYILLFSGFIFTYKLISFFIKTALMRIIAFLIFFLGSGAGFVKVFQDNVLWEKNSIREMINYLLHLPYPLVNFFGAVYPAQNILWTDFMTMFLTHQRSFFFGFASGVMIIYFLVEALKNREKKYFYFIGFFVGFLPLVHMHTFIAVLIIIFCFLIWAKIFVKDILLAKNLFKTFGIGAAIGLIISYFFILDFSSGSSLVTLRAGWMSEQGGIGSILYDPAGSWPIWAWFSYLWENFGLFFPLLILAIAYFGIRKKDFLPKKDLIYGFIFGAFGIFTVINLIKFQPWDYDNGKIFGYFYLLGSIIIVYFFEQLKFKFVKLFVFALTFILIFVGLIDTFSRSSLANPASYVIFGQKEHKAAEWIVKKISSNELILTGTSHLNPVNSLAGHPVLVGYPGWLWSHGIKYGEREKDVNDIFSNAGNAKELLKKYDISYVYIGPAERNIANFNERFFIENYRMVFQEEDIKIYKIVQ